MACAGCGFPPGQQFHLDLHPLLLVACCCCLVLLQVQCFGIRILMNVVVADRPTTCKLLYGNTNVGQFKRTVMRADVLKMPLPSLSDL